ncbi:MAG: hypothetical protein H0T79_12390 [Deltaproteobacteria bacterium]|nr:hypothetical protein [Deltaproteobacteria bacterium]
MRRTSLVAVVTLHACWAAPPPAVTPRPTVVAVYRGADFSSTIADPLGFLPADAEFVLAIDLAQLRRSSLWQTFEPHLFDKLGAAFTPVRKDCGFDPLAGLQSLTFGASTLGDKPSGTVVIRGLDRARVLACVKKGAAPRTTFDGEHLLYHSDDGSDLAVQFVDGQTAVAVIGETVTIRDLTSAVQSGSPLRSGPFADVFAELGDAKPIWFIVNGTIKQLQQLASRGVRPEWLFSTIDVGDAVVANAHLRVETAASATQLVAGVSGQLGAAKLFVERFDIAAVDRDIVVDLAATEPQVTQLLGVFGIASP